MTVPPLPKSFEQAAQLHAAIEEELERICSSRNFRTSRKSCEFLRYVVRVTLDGRLDSLKERSIGIDLLGRDASYDPSSDAAVRVRANEVRKRLASFYADREDVYSYRIFLPPGGYVPQFLPKTEELHHTPAFPFGAIAAALPGTREEEEKPVFTPLNVLVLMRPALIAFFLCVLLLRQQITHRDGYLLFWDHLLQGKNSIVVLLPNEPSNEQKELENGILPFIWLTGRYGVAPRFEEKLLQGPLEAANLHVSFTSPEALLNDTQIPFVITEREGKRLLLDRRPGNRASAFRHAAVLTVLPNAEGEIWIQGTDGESIRRLMEALTQERNFPANLNAYLSQKVPAQAVLTVEPSGQRLTQTYGPIS